MIYVRIAVDEDAPQFELDDRDHPERNLYAAMVFRALLDLTHPPYREEAFSWFISPTTISDCALTLHMCCEALQIPRYVLTNCAIDLYQHCTGRKNKNGHDVHTRIIRFAKGNKRRAT